MPENKGFLKFSPRPFHGWPGRIITADRELSRVTGVKKISARCRVADVSDARQPSDPTDESGVIKSLFKLNSPLVDATAPGMA
jgi:hypothetical protein